MRTKDKKALVLMICMLILCIGGIIGFSFSITNRLKFNSSAVTVSAVISDLRQESYNSDDSVITYTAVYVKYTYDGAEYERKLKGYEGRKQIGVEVDIQIDPDDPAKQPPADITGSIAGVVICAFFAVLSVFIYRNVRRSP